MIRKITTMAVTAFILLLFCCAVSAAQYKTGEYRVAQDRVGVYSTNDSSAVLLCELYGGSSADTVTVTQISDGLGKVYIASENVSGWVEMYALEYIGETSQITGITVTPPSKLYYVDGEEEFNPSGMHVYAVNKDGSKTEVKNYELFAPTLTGIGTKTAYVYYTDTGGVSYSAQFGVTVTRAPVASVSITKQPSKLSYIENEKLLLTGLELTVKYSDGRAAEVFTCAQILSDSDFIFTSCHNEKDGASLSVGTHKIRIAYKYTDIYTELSVSVREKKLVSFTLVSLPTYAAFYDGEGLLLDGISLSAKYDNGETESVPLSSCTVVFDADKAVIGTNNTVLLKYKTGSLSFMIEAKPLELIGVQLTPPAKTVYKRGEQIDTTGLVLTGKYNSGTKKPLTGYTLSQTDMTVLGVHTVFVSCGEYSAPFTLTVTSDRLNGDADGDGTVSAADARLTLRLAVKLDTVANEAQLTACDVDSDGRITAADARLVLRAAVKLENLG